MQDILNAINNNEYTLKISNSFIRGKYSLGITSLKLEYLGMCMLQEGGFTEVPGGLEVKFTAKQLSPVLGEKSKHIYDNLRASADEMRQCMAGFTDPDSKRFTYSSLYTSVSYNNGVFTMVFSENIKPMIFDLKNKYCLLKSGVMLSLKNRYSYKLYQYLRSNCYDKKGKAPSKNNTYEFEMNISELKYEIGVFDAANDKAVDILNKSYKPNYTQAESISSENKYANWAQFRICLGRIVREINSCKDSDIDVSYKKIGHSNIVRFTVAVKKAKKDEVVSAVNEVEKTVVTLKASEMLEDYPVSSRGIKSVVKDADYNIDIIKEAVEVLKQSKDVRNPIGFLRTAIKKRFKTYPSGSANIVERKPETWERKRSSEFYRDLEHFACCENVNRA